MIGGDKKKAGGAKGQKEGGGNILVSVVLVLQETLERYLILPLSYSSSLKLSDQYILSVGVGDMLSGAIGKAATDTAAKSAADQAMDIGKSLFK